ncbi:5'/3'-nucleotidase SurE [Haliangium sp.]|uniref:5'/3'-nucleotidase SurE n=1 Tax=Haliangium sp. TaxID=2663208 RepID=UPI003D0E0E2C
MKPLILLSNDDGIGSPYLQALADAIDEAGVGESLVVAPERQRSAASHAITLHKPLRLHSHGPGRHSLSGTPVDCVYLGIIRLAERLPALVISGINRGYNLGMDVFYSGTVAAAVEGGLRGVPALALSIDPSGDRDLGAAITFTTALAERVIRGGLPPKTVLNVNFPAHPDGRYAWTKLGRRVYEDDVDERHDPRGAPYYWIGGGTAELGDDPHTDCEAVARGVVSVTPLHLDLTAGSLWETGMPWPLDGFEHAPSAAESADPAGTPSKPPRTQRKDDNP